MPDTSPIPYRSAFGGTWTDRLDAIEELTRRLADGTVPTDREAELRQWIDEGYVVLRDATPAAAREALMEELPALHAELPVRRPGEPEPVLGSEATDAVALDLHAHSMFAREVLLATPIVDWLHLVLDDAPLLIGSIEDGCATPLGGLHRDPSLVAVSSPLELVGARAALRDGPALTVVAGSHRLPDQPFGGTRHFNPERDGAAALRAHDEQLARAAQDAGLAAVAITLSAGDVVLWAADLLHDDPSLESGATPTALVAHYCPAGRTPRWFDTLPHRTRRLSHNGGWLVSRHSELLDAPHAGSAPASEHVLPPVPPLEAVAERLHEHDADAATGAPDASSAPASAPQDPEPRSTRPAGGFVSAVRGLMGRRSRH
jgi:hypothetical protein